MPSQEMMRHMQVMLEMGAEQAGSPAAVQLERQLPLYFEVKGSISTTGQQFVCNPSCMRSLRSSIALSISHGAFVATAI